MFSSCSFDQDDPGKTVFEKYDEIQKVKSWYENKDHTKNSSKTNQLRMRLASPFGDFEKNPNWDEVDQYTFDDGRKVFEISLANKEYIYTEKYQKFFNNKDARECLKFNLMLVENKVTEDFDVFIVRYYTKDRSDVELSNYNTYRSLHKKWSGEIESFDYSNTPIAGFGIEKGKIINSKRPISEKAKSRSSNLASGCTMSSTEHCFGSVQDNVPEVECRTSYYIYCVNDNPPLLLGGPEGSNGGPGTDGPPTYPGPAYVCDSMDPDCIPFPGGGSGGELEDPAPTYTIINAVIDPCMAAQVDKAVNNDFKNKITNLIWDAFGESEIYNIVIDDYDEQNPSLDGSVQYGVSGDVVNFYITLNSGVLASASQEYIMATIFHELLHAYLGYLNIDALNNSADHENMVNNYLGLLSEALMEHFSISSIDANHLSWGGLHETQKWADLPQGTPTAIDNTNQEYRTSAKGQNCN
jgi:hypothetical protein